MMLKKLSLMKIKIKKLNNLIHLNNLKEMKKK